MKNTMKNFALDIMLMALGPVFFAQEATKVGGGKNSTPKVSAKAPDAPAQETATAEAAKPKRAALTIQSLKDIESMPEAERKALLEAAGKRAAVGAGTVGKYVRADGNGFTDDPALAKRAQDGRGRLIAQYTPPRDADVVATEELTRMLRLQWARTARTKAAEAQSKRKTELTEADLIKILNESGVPESYMRPKASKRLYGRVLSFIKAGPLPEETKA